MPRTAALIFALFLLGAIILSAATDSEKEETLSYEGSKAVVIKRSMQVLDTEY